MSSGASGGGIVVVAGDKQIVSSRRDSGGRLTSPRSTNEPEDATTARAISLSTGEAKDDEPEQVPSPSPAQDEKKGICGCVLM